LNQNCTIIVKYKK